MVELIEFALEVVHLIIHLIHRLLNELHYAGYYLFLTGIHDFCLKKGMQSKHVRGLGPEVVFGPD